MLAFYGIKLTIVSFEQKLLILKTTEKLIVTNVGLKNKEGCNLHQADLFKEKQITWIFPLKDLFYVEQKIEIEHCSKKGGTCSKEGETGFNTLPH